MSEILQILWFSGFLVFMWWATWEDEHHQTRRKIKRFWLAFLKEVRSIIREIFPPDDLVCVTIIMAKGSSYDTRTKEA